MPDLLRFSPVVAVVASMATSACSRAADILGSASPQPSATQSPSMATAPPAPNDASPVGLAAPDARACGGDPMTVRFYDVGEGLSALVTLPGGAHVLVDTGDSPRRARCGEACASAHARLLGKLRRDLGRAPIDLVWITHPHSDHVGGAPEILGAFPAVAYVDNGRDLEVPEVQLAREAAAEHGVAVHVVDPEHRDVPLRAVRDVRARAALPPEWPASCRNDANECSLGLRLDYCASSVLFTGDAEHGEERVLDVGGPVTLLQVAHHGSDSSTTPALLAKARPRYAVVSVARPGEGLNREYCLPRAVVIERLTRVLGGPGARAIDAFDGDRCDRATPADWVPMKASDRLWATSRDGDVVLTTTGDGRFTRETP